MVVGISLATLSSITKSIQRSSILERSNQLFYGAEAGTEAAFFHHNARGQGVDFDMLSGGDLTTPSEPQVLNLPNTSIYVAWELEGRDDTSREALLHEHETVQIPFYWDVSDINDDIGTDTAEFTNFSLQFCSYGTNCCTDPDEPCNSVTIPNGFDFGKDNSEGVEVLIDWTISCQTDKGVKTFSPRVDNTETNPCDPISKDSFICEEIISSGGNYSIEYDSTVIQGRYMPCRGDATACQLNLSEFINNTSDLNPSDCKITFRPLLKFEDTNSGAKIPGIPYEFENTTPGEIPKSTYTVTSRVTMGDFSQEIETSVREPVSIGAFDYVIFD